MEKQYFNLTNPQNSIWLTCQMFPGTPIGNICGTVVIDEKVDFTALEKSINNFIEKNDSFRIIFENVDNTVKQYVSKYIPFSIEIKKVNSNEEVSNLEKELVSHPFPVIGSLLFKFIMFRFPDGHGGFTINAHHLVSDAWTAGLVVDEVMDYYAFLIGKIPEYSHENSSYIDYIASEKEYCASERFQKDKEYWNNQFKSVPEVAKIPSIKPKNITSCSSGRIQFNLSKDIISKINEYCINNRASIFNFFMAVFGIYIGRAAGLDDFVIGTPILNRTSFKEKNATGMFISTVPFRILLNGDESFSSFISRIAKDSLGMLRHQKYPYSYLLSDLRKKDSSMPNLYDILISYQNVRSDKQKSTVAYHAEWTSNGCLSDGINIHLSDMNDTGSLEIDYDYLLERYTENDILIMHQRILHIINQVLENESISLESIEIITPNEKQKIVYDFNNTKIEYDKNLTITQIFENQVSKTPEAPAMAFEGHFMTYKELNERANSLAFLLRKKGVTNNSIVSIMLNRSFEMIVAILAVLKSGGAYMPIDPEYPDDRIKYMIENSKSKYLITSSSMPRKNINIENEIYADLNLDLYNSHKDNLKNINNEKDLSYIIYTSGSTGTPKGVMLTHKNLSNFCASMYDKIEYLKNPRGYSIISITTVSFDIFVFETLVSLTRGLALFMTNYFEQKITAKLERLIMDNKIDILQTTPSIMKYHLDNLTLKNSLAHLKYVMLAGEQLPKMLVDRIKKIAPNCTIYNGYGPSETTIFSTVKNVTNDEEITIGKPIGNTQIYILDEKYRFMPPNTLGEIYISGDGVGNGYLSNPEMTAKGFIDNPFEPGTKLYKTGDLGCWLENGTIKCFGRSDNQIKIRGLRIEIGEIEEIINSYAPDDLMKSVILAKNDDGNISLHAFISSLHDFSIDELKAYISSKLPMYMIPNTFTRIDKFPLTPNGKIDRKSLSKLKINKNDCSSENAIPPRNNLDSILLNVIKANLNTNTFGIDQNIFDYGADSLIIINILTELFRYDFGIKVSDFYQFPTVRQLSNHISSKSLTKKEDNEDKLLETNNIVKKLNTNTSAQIINSKKNILITGCTGFLGAHMLAQILERPENISSIYCLIRQKQHIEPRARLIDVMNFYFGNKYDNLLKKYVSIIEADISQANLGTNPVAFKLLKENVDCVIHCAANVKHYGNFSDFEKANIIGTQNIVNFCIDSNVELHYISTMTVSGNYLVKQLPKTEVFDETCFFNGQNFNENVYSKSKLLAEQYVISSLSKGLQATIYRIGDLSGRYSDGVFQKNIEENSIYLRLKSILEIGAISSSVENLELEFSPIDYAALAITKIIWSSSYKNRIFHIYNPNKISVASLVKMLKNFKEIKFMNPEEFNAYIKRISTNGLSQSQLKGIINDFTDNFDLIYNYTIKESNEITCKYLQNLGFEWPKLTKQYFDLLLEYMKKVNFIN